MSALAVGKLLVTALFGLVFWEALRERTPHAAAVPRA
jgi:hypothetical protein